MSHGPLVERRKPRWSVAGQLRGGTASRAGLPGRRARVTDSPPLDCSLPRSGSLPVLLLATAPESLQPPFWIRLKSSELKTCGSDVRQSSGPGAPMFRARIVLLLSTLPALKTPPVPVRAELWLIVVFVSLTAFAVPARL